MEISIISEIILILIVSLAFGSYSTLFIYRTINNESYFGRYFGPKSRCPKCKEIIPTKALIPIINWYITRGKCLNQLCDYKIDRKYLISEILHPVIFFILYYKYGITDILIIYCILCSILIVAILSTIDNPKIADPIIYSLFTFSLLKASYNYNISDIIIISSIAFIFIKFFYQIFNNYINYDHRLSLNLCKLILISPLFLDLKYYYLSLVIIYLISVIYIFALSNYNNNIIRIIILSLYLCLILIQ